jgi:UMF1 family MFS transporter
VPRPGRARDAWREVARTLRGAGRFPDLSRFLAASLFYQAGVHTVIALAAIYATQAMHFTTRQTLVLIFAVNFAAAAGALLFGHAQDRIGPVRALAIVLGGWLVTIAVAAGAHTPAPFWAAAALAGLCLGASLSGGRALVGLLSPPSRRAEFFGFWGLATKLSAILGPLSYGLVTWISGGNHRLALMLTAVFFLAGLALLAGVRAGRGRRAALRAERDFRNATP